MSGQPLLGQDRWFWVAYAAMLLLVVAVGLRSITMAVALVAVLAGLALLAPTFGTKKGTLRLSILLLVTVLVLPDDMALKYRIPVGGGGIFIIDILLALLVMSWAVHMLSQRRVALIRSPVTLPLVLFLLWVAVSGVNGYLSGNDVKVILQDARGLIYFVLFLWVVTSKAEKSLVYLLLRVLAGCMVVGFIQGLYGLAVGQGTQLTYVEAGVSRFPAPNEVFVMSATLLVTFIVMWPGRQRRPWYLWPLLFVSLVAVLLAFVRGYWIGLAVGLLYLVLVGRTQQRLRLVVSVMALLTLARCRTGGGASGDSRVGRHTRNGGG